MKPIGSNMSKNYRVPIGTGTPIQLPIRRASKLSLPNSNSADWNLYMTLT